MEETISLASKIYQKLLKINGMKVCGQNIRKIRRDRDLTQEYMAFEMGISQKAYSDIENSKVKINLEILTKISKILDIKPSDICSISDQCSGGDYEDKYNDLLEFMKKNNLPLPEEHL
ncbi:helix-turn-helix domain-containing protein [Chryseobacterium sp. C-71]|uniref:helix-turn-helix domain-containing protein n=1 Tax=Chryseobacterium sp. C-71 TaxID=2893882 RepID=UPI001E5647FD|nr:helix-turn-helix transcriptional regulator [Chryseobacterium sp. C-71]UFH32327.1 helix-turn-helix domain-containing protein [Chryseobacterium sp. C-71]